MTIAMSVCGYVWMKIQQWTLHISPPHLLNGSCFTEIEGSCRYVWLCLLILLHNQWNTWDGLNLIVVILAHIRLYSIYMVCCLCIFILWKRSKVTVNCSTSLTFHCEHDVLLESMVQYAGSFLDKTVHAVSTRLYSLDS